MNHDLEMRLRRDARAAELAAPEHVIARVRQQLEHEPLREATSERRGPRMILLAAAILVAAGGAYWAVTALVGRERVRVRETPTVVETPRESGTTTSGLLALTWPSQGVAMATRVDEPLAREWELLKSDSLTLLRGFERQIPRLSSRD